ncbi:MAG: peroxide stress protein YaaA [bacterium]
MIVLLSPAKTLNENPQDYPFKPTIPDFLDDAQVLVNKLQKLSLKGLERLMSINRKIAETNRERFQDWEQPFTPENAKPAAYLFRGEVYIGLDATTLTADDLAFAQDHLRILSGLYGLLRPMDLMRPYRLEMGTVLKTGRKKNLYEFWGNRLADTLAENMASHQSKVIINLASEEYFRSLQPKTLEIPVITPTFKEEREGGLKSIQVYAKRARGLMARYIMDHRLEAPEGMTSFNRDGYRFSRQDSDSETWVFVRPHTGPKT